MSDLSTNEEELPARNAWQGAAGERGRCGHEMRTGPCQMDPGHRGRHSTVVSYCDGCGRASRGSVPYKSYPVMVCGEQDDLFGFCFSCVELAKDPAIESDWR